MADAHGSGPCVRKDVGVQLPPCPPNISCPAIRPDAPSRRPLSPLVVGLGLPQRGPAGKGFALSPLVVGFAPTKRGPAGKGENGTGVSAPAELRGDVGQQRFEDVRAVLD